MKRQKMITIIMSYNYDDRLTASNDKIARRIESDLRKGVDPHHERIESVTVTDVTGNVEEERNNEH